MPDFVDIHSHILHGLDDGASTLNESIAMLEMARDAGTTDIVATPHADTQYAFDPQRIEARIAELSARVSGITVHRGCDFRLEVSNIVQDIPTATNPRSTKNKIYSYASAVKWFRQKEAVGLLDISESVFTWRCHPRIAAFSDTIFDPSWKFPETHSKNDTTTDHDGVYLVGGGHVAQYVSQYQPQCLRHSVGSGKDYDLDYLNFKISKGMAYERVLIVPTEPIAKFVSHGTHLAPGPASSFYVAVTRARQSVAIVLDVAHASTLPRWQSAA